jgi:hypothetical protein
VKHISATVDEISHHILAHRAASKSTNINRLHLSYYPLVRTKTSIGPSRASTLLRQCLIPNSPLGQTGVWSDCADAEPR